MRKYLSHGVGVNSTALMLLLIDDNVEFESVFSDTGCENPETYEYLDYLQKRGYEITRIIPQVKEKRGIYDNLYDYFWSWQGIPIIHRRQCCVKFKKQPVDKYVKQPCEVMLGYDFNERKRRRTKNRKQITFIFPLIERKITREQCVDIIREHGLLVPIRSGCYLCPYQSKKTWKRLRDNHPDLFMKAMALEENAITRKSGKQLYQGGNLSSICPSGVQGFNGHSAYQEVVISRRPLTFSKPRRRRRQENKLTSYLEAEK